MTSQQSQKSSMARKTAPADFPHSTRPQRREPDSRSQYRTPVEPGAVLDVRSPANVSLPMTCGKACGRCDAHRLLQWSRRKSAGALPAIAPGRSANSPRRRRTVRNQKYRCDTKQANLQKKAPGMIPGASSRFRVTGCSRRRRSRAASAAGPHREPPRAQRRRRRPPD